MTAPAIVFGLVIATLLAAAYHLLLGQSLRQLAVFWLASVAGFLAGHLLAGLLPVRLPQLGLLHPIEGALVSLAAMTIVRASRL